MARASSATSSDAATVDGRRSTVIGRLFNRPLLLLIALFILLAPLATRRIYASDEIKYYAYTHSLFFDGDLDFSNDYLHWYEVDPSSSRRSRPTCTRRASRSPACLPTKRL